MIRDHSNVVSALIVVAFALPWLIAWQLENRQAARVRRDRARLAARARRYGRG